MRTKNAIKNMFATWLGQALLILVNLLSRRYFLQLLGAEYLGIDSLFSNILSFLSLAELGIGSAITYGLYKPLAENDTEQIKALMQLYRIAYWCIGGFVLAAGLLLVPVLPLLITGGEGIERIRFYYVFFVFNTAVSYFFSYKSAFLIANQKKYIYSTNHYLWKFLMYSAQIVVLRLTGSYTAYLVCQISCTVLENVSISHIAEKRYPILKEKATQKLPRAKLDELKRNTLAMMLDKVGSTLISSTDNILISTMIGIATVGIYGNYTTIYASLHSVLYQGMFSIVAVLGNLAVTATDEKKQGTYRQLYFIVVWLYGWSTITLFNLFTPFIRLWYGAQYTIGSEVVFLICLNLYLAGQAIVNSMHIQAFGLYWTVRYKSIIEALINLVSSVILAKPLGLAGILLGTVLSRVCWSFWQEANTVFRNGLHRSAKGYYLRFAKDTCIIGAAGLVTCFAVAQVPGTGAGAFLVKAALCVVVPNVLLLACFCRRPEFKAVLGQLRKVLLARKGNQK